MKFVTTMPLLLAGFAAVVALQTPVSVVDAWAPPTLAGTSYHRSVSVSSRDSQRAHSSVPTLLSASRSHGPYQRPLWEQENDEQHSFDPLRLSSSLTTTFSMDSKADSEAGASTCACADWDAPLRALVLGAIAMGTPEMAMAAVPAGGGAVPSALAAYGHYLSIVLMVASIMTERLTVKAAMSVEEEKLLATADIVTGVAGVLLLVSGYYRATAYGKGWDFYSHEPIFWLKMASLGVFGALSLFPTITIIQRSVKIQQEGTIEPMSEELATRMRKVLNAELTALAFIPLTATLMARGVGYVNDFPTEIVGPALFGVVTAGGCYKYVKDAITWKEPASSAGMTSEE